MIFQNWTNVFHTWIPSSFFFRWPLFYFFFTIADALVYFWNKFHCLVPVFGIWIRLYWGGTLWHQGPVCQNMYIADLIVRCTPHHFLCNYSVGFCIAHEQIMKIIKLSSAAKEGWITFDYVLSLFLSCLNPVLYFSLECHRHKLPCACFDVHISNEIQLAGCYQLSAEIVMGILWDLRL